MKKPLILTLPALLVAAPLFTAPLLIASPALADARDDVLASMARCGSIADPRQWLDCYYGAAQPMRAQLGLTPAPAAQVRLVPGGAAAYAPALATPAMAAPGMAAPGMAAPVLRGPAPQPAGPPPMPAKKKSTGLMTGLFGGTVLLSNMRASAYSFNAKGIFSITLADGEVWQQLQDDTSYAQWREPAQRLVVTIKEGALGSYNLRVASDNRMYKVRRVQ